MREYANLAWPGDPYRTGQQLYRRPSPRLAAFTAGPPVCGSRYGPAAVATVYLPLHRTRTRTVTEQTLVFGFRAVSIDGPAEAAALAAAADLDLMRARRHAAVLAGHLLDGDLAGLRRAAAGTELRGVAAVGREWADRRRQAPGMAAMFDVLLDLPGQPSLPRACRQAGIAVGLGGSGDELEHPARGELLAAVAVERALVIALICARHLGCYTWDTTLRTARVMAAGAWDCLPHLGADGQASALGCQRHSGPAAATSSAHGGAFDDRQR